MRLRRPADSVEIVRRAYRTRLPDELARCVWRWSSMASLSLEYQLIPAVLPSLPMRLAVVTIVGDLPRVGLTARRPAETPAQDPDFLVGPARPLRLPPIRIL